jgi:hypothetical protein
MRPGRTSEGKRLFSFVVFAFLSTASIASCAGHTEPPQGNAPPPAAEFSAPPGVTRIPTDFRELPLDHATEQAATVPWHLIRVDRQENRVYLSASSVDCTIPGKVRLAESATEVSIIVAGTSTSGPCTAQSVSIMGYVQIGSIGGRRVTGNSS